MSVNATLIGSTLWPPGTLPVASFEAHGNGTDRLAPNKVSNVHFTPDVCLNML